MAAQRSAETWPQFNQSMLDRLIRSHERFLDRLPGGRRATAKYLKAPGLILSNHRLTDADFTGANLENCRMIGADFQRASLYCANLRRTDARVADFRRADIRGATLRGANLSGANLDEADMRQAMLVRADVPGRFRVWLTADDETGDGAMTCSVDLSNCSMKGVKLNHARLKWANLSGALLQGADLGGADLSGARLTRAVLTGVNVEGLKVDPSALAECIVDPSPAVLARAPRLAVLVENHCRWVESNGRHGEPAVLDKEDIRPLRQTFRGLALTAMSARDVCAIGVDFGKAQLQGAQFDGADLRDANFAGADLRGASFKGAELWHANFEGADVGSLSLTGGSNRAVNVDGASGLPEGFSNRLALSTAI